MLAGAVVVGVFFAVAAQNGFVTVSGALLIAAIAAFVLVSGRLESRSSQALVASAPLLALALVFRSSAWVVAFIGCAIAIAVVLGVSFAAAGSMSSTFPMLGGRIGVALTHMAMALGMLRSPDDDAESPSASRNRAVALARGIGLAVPVVVVIGSLLAAADPVFEAVFHPPRILENVVLVATGAWLALGLYRAASAKKPEAHLPGPPSLGTVEVVSVLGALCALYAVFVTAQLVALTGGADHVLATSGLTYAEYARSGFFQLLAAATITLIVLLSLRACADRSRLSVLIVSEATIALTLAVVAVAIQRLDFYQSAYGLTMLRLGSTVTAAWIGLVFVLLGMSVARRGSNGRWFSPTVVLSAVVLIAVWAISNPAAVVAETNLGRAGDGRRFDVQQAVSLGPDAVPTLVDGLDDLDPADRRRMLALLCERPADNGWGAGFNNSRARSDEALGRACPASGKGD